MVKPKVALLENVSGILNAFNDNGEQFYAWFEVAKAFAKVGYLPLCLNVNAKFAGVAQNRPRFILIAIRRDFYSQIKKKLKCKNFIKLLQTPLKFFKSIKNGNEPQYGDLDYYDAEENYEMFKDSILSPLVEFYNKHHTVKDAIHDLSGEKLSESKYVRGLNKLFKNHNNLPINKYNNHELRRNSSKIKARFRLYQLLPQLKKANASAISKYLKAFVSVVDEDAIEALCKSMSSSSDDTLEEIKNFLRSVDDLELEAKTKKYLFDHLPKLKDSYKKEIKKHFRIKNDAKVPREAYLELHQLEQIWLLDLFGKKIEKPSLKQIINLVASLKTKKQTQRVLIPNQPAPAALSIPDDACHYDETLDNLRTLTVREMARIQSFPDWYEVKSKVTTGGQQRKYEVPQYTQMGNAVPPFLGYALGKICNKVLSI